MAEITAAMVKELRERTGQAMMDCKRALAETDGDMEKAVQLLRKKGMAVMEKRADRLTNEGRVIGKISTDGKRAVLVAMCSETDFTAKNDDFTAVSEAVADALLAADNAPDNAEALGALPVGERKVADIVNDIVSKTGEKVTVGQFCRFDLEGPGLLHCYIHFNNKIGTVLWIDTDSDAASEAEEVRTLAADLAMHITAVNPVAVDRDGVDKEQIAREREVAVSQVVGKPENMVERIVEGKLGKWFKQIVLLEQPFVKDDSKTVGGVLDEVGKKVGGKLTMKRFMRVQIG